MADASKARLHTAAEELVKAALESSSTTSLAAARDSLVELRQIHGGTDILAGKVPRLLEVVESAAVASKAQIGAIETSLVGLKAAIGEQAVVARILARTQSIQWALSNTALGSFIFYKVEPGSSIYNSAQMSSQGLMVDILLHFNRGNGAVLPTAGCDVHCFSSDKTVVAKSQAEFNDKVVEQLHGLLGEKPVIRPAAEAGKYVISLTSLRV